MHAALTVWWKANDILNLKLSSSTLTPIWHNPIFKINKEPIKFTAWKRRGVTSLGHLFSGCSFMTFDLINQTFNLPHCYYQYIQSKETMKKKTDIHNFHNSTPPLLLKLCLFKPKKNIITDLQTIISIPIKQMDIRLEYRSNNYMQQYIFHVIQLKNSTSSIQGPAQSTHHHSQNAPYGLHRQQHLHILSHCSRQPLPHILGLLTSWLVFVGGHGKAVLSLSILLSPTISLLAISPHSQSHNIFKFSS